MPDAPRVVRMPPDGAGLAAAAAAPGREDLLLLAEGATVPEGLLAAAADTTTATASALTTGEPSQPPRHPRIPVPGGGAVLVRRWALDLAGPFDGSFAGAQGALEDLAERLTQRGLSHVLADDVRVDAVWAPLDEADRARLDAAYPHRAAAARIAEDPESPLRRVLRPHGTPVTVTVDARSIGPYRAGTQVHALQLVLALARTGRVRVRALVAADLSPDADALFAADERIETITYEQAAHGDPPVDDVVHRPSQVFTPDDLALIEPLGRRLVITHQDLIAYRTPGLHDGPEAWERFRRSTRLALGVADHVTFFSEHARADALAEDLVTPETSSVVPIGVDHHAPAEPQRPDGVPDGPFLLYLGADLPHKNQAFAVRLAEALERPLVIAGPGDAGLGPVSEEEKAWLLAGAEAVLYPTLYEGFGLIPFEAAAAGTPCAWAPVASLAEVLPPELATLVPWDVEASAAAVRGLGEAHVRAVNEHARRYTWDATAHALVDRYEALLAAPRGEGARGARERLRLLEELHRANRTHMEWREAIGSDAIGLVGPNGVLSPEDQRALLALASRPPLRRALLAPMRGAYRLIKRA